jgi:DNA-binding transcriptional LysR family regulator
LPQHVGIRISSIRDSSLIARKIGTVKSVLCASPNYLKRHGYPKSVGDLAAHACLAHLSLAPNDRVWTLQGPKGTRSVDIGGPFFSDSALALRAAALAGAGVALLPEYCIRDDLAEGALIRLLPQFMPAPRPILAVRPRSMYRTDKVQLFRWFKQHDTLHA